MSRMAKRSKDRVVWLSPGFFPVAWGFCPSEKAWRREMKRLGPADTPFPSTAGCCTALTSKDGKLAALVTINGAEAHKPIEVIGLMAHEVTHVWQEIRDKIGEDKPSPEFEAYSIQALLQELLCAYEDTRGWKLKFAKVSA